MSWDGLIFNGKDVPESLEEVEKTWRPYALGVPEKVRSKISSYLPSLIWENTETGIFQTKEFSIEFTVLKKETLENISVRVLGNGTPIPILLNLCDHNNWVLFDNQHGDLIRNVNTAKKSWNKFINWRDQSVNIK